MRQINLLRVIAIAIVAVVTAWGGAFYAQATPVCTDSGGSGRYECGDEEYQCKCGSQYYRAYTRVFSWRVGKTSILCHLYGKDNSNTFGGYDSWDISHKGSASVTRRLIFGVQRNFMHTFRNGYVSINNDSLGKSGVCIPKQRSNFSRLVYADVIGKEVHHV